MSFDEFINRPKFEVEHILTIVDEIDKKKAKMAEPLLADLEKTSNKIKGELDLE